MLLYAVRKKGKKEEWNTGLALVWSPSIKWESLKARQGGQWSLMQRMDAMVISIEGTSPFIDGGNINGHKELT